MFAVAEVAIPLRGYIFSAQPNWDREHYLFSWKFRVNDIRGSLNTKYYLTDKRTNETLELLQEEFLTPLQIIHVNCNPTLIHQFCHEMAKRQGNFDLIYVDGSSDTFNIP